MKLESLIVPALPLLLVVTGSVGLAQASRDHGGPGGQDRDTGRLFQRQCASCHVVPDAAVHTDRAWLDQIQRTT